MALFLYNKVEGIYRWKREEERGKKEDGRRKREEGRGKKKKYV